MSKFLPVEPKVKAKIADILTELIGRPVATEPSWGDLLMDLPESPSVPHFGPLPTFEDAKQYKKSISRLDNVRKAGIALHDAILALEGEIGMIDDLASSADFSGVEREQLFKLTQIFEPTAIASVSAAMVGLCASSAKEALCVEQAANTPERPKGGKPPTNLTADLVARKIAVFYVKWTGKIPSPSFGNHDGYPSNPFSKCTGQISELLGIQGPLAGAVKRACEYVQSQNSNLE